MTLHVDFVDNDWLGGQQRVIARVKADGWKRGDIERRMLEAVTKAMGNGSYAFATEPHEGRACPFRFGTLSMKSIPVPPQP